MVTNYTANQIGDVFYSTMIEPYTSVKKILGWDIIAGVTTPNTYGKLNFIDAITTVTYTGVPQLPLIAGQEFIVGNVKYQVHEIIDATTFTLTEAPVFTASGLSFYLLPDSNNQFSYEYSWSQEPEGSSGGQMSEFLPLGPSLLALEFDPNKPLWIRLKLSVTALGDANTISLLSNSFTLETDAGTIVVCPDFCGDCTDSIAMDGCANIIVDCDDNLYDPYNLKQPTKTYEQLTELSTDIWGHTVKYFRVEPDKRSKDVILMEYSLYNVVEQGELKIMVPDNEMPTAQFSYDIFGMGFEDFEIHLTKGQFKNAFGIGPSPRMRDYLYFPLVNRMYEVNAVQYADEFNKHMTYWKLFLKKFEERTSNIITDTTVEQELEDLTVGVDEIFGEEIKDEYTQTTKPTQYQTTFTEVGDGTRFRINTGLKIIDGEIRNRWTLVSKNHYDLRSTQDSNVELLVYNKKSQLGVKDNLAFTAWIRPKFVGNTHQIIFDGYKNNKGLEISINAEETIIKINNDLHTIAHEVALDNKTWYGFVFNLNNGIKTFTVSTYKLDPMSNWQNSSTMNKTFERINHTAKNFSSPYGWMLEKKYQLMPADLDITNIRLFKKIIGTEQHMNILQQYIVRDNQLAHIIDNAIPSINLRRYDQSR